MRSKEKIKEPGFEVVTIDYEKKDSYFPHFKGVDALFIIPPSTPNRGELAAQMIKAAEEAGVKHVALFSVLGGQ